MGLGPFSRHRAEFALAQPPQQLEYHPIQESTMRTTLTAISIALLAFSATAAVSAAPTTVEIHQIDANGIGASLGTISATDSSAGLVLTPRLKGLSPGEHGFHLHEKADCGPGEKDGKVAAGLAAGGHLDPKGTGKHLGPAGDGHLGDLPALTIDADGSSTKAATAARLKQGDLTGRALVIHAEADNYADKPGGARIACGTIK